MPRLVIAVLTLAAISISTVVATAGAETRVDYCAPPKMETAKWHLAPQERGMSVMLPPGFAFTGSGSTLGRGASSLGFSPDSYRSNAASDDGMDMRLYSNGHRSIMVGGGQGPAYLMNGSATQSSECEVIIGERRVRITAYNWTVQDGGMQSSAESGDHYALLAQYMPAGGMPEVYVGFASSFKSDLMSNRELFWTATFGGGTATPASSTPATTPVTPSTANVSQVAPAPACVPDQHVPAANAILDTALVQTLVSGAGPVPKGFVQLALRFSGETLASIMVAQSDLPDSTQRQLATLVASNVRAHDARDHAQFLLRVDTQEQGLRYAVQPACIP